MDRGRVPACVGRGPQRPGGLAAHHRPDQKQLTFALAKQNKAPARLRAGRLRLSPSSLRSYMQVVPTQCGGGRSAFG